ncbi:sensor histidine kinase [Roseivirga sp.]|uniref:tetratricopeptide repeat-containing sensor histidine kinase n=1 Tax=Roseivirga sp. TaxID=1964215 RepID=UPI002B267589|nr:sensor histidine kinase [Roseivirga sp.]
MKKYFYVLLIVLMPNILLGQDSLRFKQLVKKAESNYYVNPDSTLYYAKELVTQASRANDLYFLGEGNRLIGVYYQLSAKPDSALYNFEEAITIYKQIQDSTQLIRVIISAGVMETGLGNYNKALTRFLEGQLVAEKVGNEAYRLRTVAEIGRIYSIQGEHEKALKQMQYYYAKVKDSNEISEVAAALNYLTGEFMLLDIHDSSLYYLEKNLEVQKKLDFPIGIAAVLQNRATVYGKMAMPERALVDFEQALDYYRKANFSQGIGQVSINSSAVFIRKRDFKKAIELLNEGVYHSYLIKDYHALRAQYYELASAYDSIGDKAHAFESFKNFSAMNDTLMSIDKQRTMSDLFTKYETKEKEQQIELQQSALSAQEARLERNQALIIGLVFIALLLIIMVLLNRNRAKKKEQLIQQEAQLKLREAELNAVINSQEKERNRFARDLHDGFGQLISVLKLNLSSLADKDARQPEKRLEIFQNGESVINDMYAELRSICFDLMPQTLVKNGLSVALREFGDRITQSKKVVCEVIVFGDEERLPELIEISLFRICQEWVNNVMKYAESSRITIQLTRDETELTLTVEDDGKGFDAEFFYSGKGNGWKNIQTRLNLIKGEFDLDTHPDRCGSMMTVNLANASIIKIPTSTESEITA